MSAAPMRSAPKSRAPRLPPSARLVALVLLAAGVASCDSSPLLFPSPEGLELASGNHGSGTIRGTAGEVLIPALRVRVVDGSGNPVPNATVRVEVEGGGGSVARSELASNRHGQLVVEGWRLGETAGANRLRLQVSAHGSTSLGGAAGPQLLLEADGVPGAASRILSVGPPPPALEGTVGEPLPADVRFRIEDRFGNPVPGVDVTFALPSGSGTVTSAAARTDAAGEITPGSWTLGPEAGPQLLRAVAVGVAGVAMEIEALARPGVADRIRLEGELPETAPAGERLGDQVDALPGVRVVDAFGNPLPDIQVSVTPLANSGTVDPSTLDTGPTGTEGRLPDWTLGTRPGRQGLRLEAQGLAGVPPLDVVLEATDGEVGAWQVNAVHVNQGNQTFRGSVPLVAGRPGLLRVFLQGSTGSPPGIRVRIRIRQGTAVVLDEVVSRAGGGGIQASEPEPDDEGRSWNLPLAAGLLQPGAELRVDVDPDELLLPAPLLPVTWPEGGGWQPLDVRELPTFRATFIPIQITQSGLTGRITPANLQEYVGPTVDQFPIGAVDFEVRTDPMVYDGSFDAPGPAWVAILEDIRDLRLAEGGHDRYYHGILRRPPGPGIAGIAYVATRPQGIDNLAAVSFDELPTAGPVIAHEFGHNFGRNHAPCGNLIGVDPAFPHPGGELGSPGYSAATGMLRPTTGFRDVMGYCFPFWASDYTFGAIRAMREARPLGISLGTHLGMRTGPGHGVREGILVGGSWSGSMATRLRPAIRLEAPATPTDPGGEVLIQVLDAGGAVLSSGRYPGARLDHADDPTLRHFGAVLPLPAGSGAPAAIRVTTPGGVAVLATSPAPADAAPVVVSVVSAAPQPGADDPTASGPWTRIRWDAETFPVLVLREAETGRIRGFLRSGDALVAGPSPTHGAPALRLDLSDGVRTLESVPTRAEPPQR